VVAAALGAARPLTGRDRWRITALFVTFEAGMPLVGPALGAPLAHAVGDIPDYLASAGLIAVGAWMLIHDNEANKRERTNGLLDTHGWALLGVGLSISLDELAIGFTLGLGRLPTVAVILAITVQAFLAVQAGLWLGSHIGERLRDAVQHLAGIALIAVGLVLLAGLLLT